MVVMEEEEEEEEEGVETQFGNSNTSKTTNLPGTCTTSTEISFFGRFGFGLVLRLASKNYC